MTIISTSNELNKVNVNCIININGMSTNNRNSIKHGLDSYHTNKVSLNIKITINIITTTMNSHYMSSVVCIILIIHRSFKAYLYAMYTNLQCILLMDII